MLRPEIVIDHIETDGDHFALLRHILATHRPRGTALEFGVGTGESGRIIAAAMPLVTFGSEDGLPEDWRPGFAAGSFAHPAPRIDNAQVITGLFSDTLPNYDFEAIRPIGLAHFDADLRSSTAAALKYAGPHLKAGTFLVFDEFHGFPGAEDHEQAALAEWAEATKVEYDVIGYGHEAYAIQLKTAPAVLPTPDSGA